MNEILEMWSHPWHALQRSLATKGASDAAWSMVAGRRMTGWPASPNAVGAQDSWLVRAPARVQPSVRRGL